MPYLGLVIAAVLGLAALCWALPRVPLDTDLWESGDQPSQLDQWDRGERRDPFNMGRGKL